MSKVLAGSRLLSTGTSPDPTTAEPGLGEGGERLRDWVFGGPWRYEDETRGEASGEDAAWLEAAMSRLGAMIAGRATYEAAGHWSDRPPWGCRSSSSRTGPKSSDEFVFVAGVETASLVRSTGGTRNVRVIEQRGRHPPGAGGRARRRADDHRRAGRARRRRGAVRRLRADARPGAARRAPVALRDVPRLPRRAVSRRLGAGVGGHEEDRQQDQNARHVADDLHLPAQREYSALKLTSPSPAAATSRSASSPSFRSRGEKNAPPRPPSTRITASPHWT